MTKLVNSILEDKEDFLEFVKEVSSQILIEEDDEQDEIIIEELIELFENEEDFDVLMENVAAVPVSRLNRIANKISDSKYLNIKGMTKGSKKLANFLNKHRRKIAVAGIGAMGAVHVANTLAANPLPTAIVGGAASLGVYNRLKKEKERNKSSRRK